MEALVQDKQVGIINNSIEIFRTAPEILKANQERSQKALAVGSGILQSWLDAWNIEDEEGKMEALAAVDTRSNNYLANCNKALKEEKETRAAITQMMDEFKKMFTSAENDIDRTKANTIPSKVQSNRDAYAQEVFKIQERKRVEAERKAEKDSAIIDLKASIEISLSEFYNNELLAAKQKLQGDFNRVTLDNYEKANSYFQKYKAEDITHVFERFQFRQNLHRLISENEYYEFFNPIKAAFLESKKHHWGAELTGACFEYFNQMPSKKTELEEEKRLADEAAALAEKARKEEEERQAAIAKANSDERKRLEEESAKAREEVANRQAEIKRQHEEAEAARKQREKDESLKIKAQADEAQRIAQQEAEIKKQGEQTMVMFEQEAAIAETQAPEARQGYEITVTHQAGFVQIFQLWFENEGKNLPVDKIGNTKLDQMKTWAEKYAHKTGTKIESKFLNYKESFTAVNRKAK